MLNRMVMKTELAQQKKQKQKQKQKTKQKKNPTLNALMWSIKNPYQNWLPDFEHIDFQLVMDTVYPP